MNKELLKKIKENQEKTVNEAVAKVRDEIIKEISQNQIESKTGEDDVKKSEELEGRFYRALAEKDNAKLREVSEEVAKIYEAKGQSVGVNEDGGYLVPITLERRIIEKLEEFSPIRQMATVISNLPAKLNLPFATGLPTAEWIAEGEAPEESKATFDIKSLEPHKLGAFVKFTHESLNDTATVPALREYVADGIAKVMAQKEIEAFVTGDGINKPLGFRNATGVNIVALEGTELTWKDLVQLKLSVPKMYRGRGDYVTSTKGISTVLGLKDASDRPVYLTNLHDSEEGRILGRPVHEFAEIPENENGTEMWFGDFKNYIIGDRGALRINFGTTGNDLEQDKVSLVAFKRTTGAPMFGDLFSKIEFDS